MSSLNDTLDMLGRSEQFLNEISLAANEALGTEHAQMVLEEALRTESGQKLAQSLGNAGHAITDDLQKKTAELTSEVESILTDPSKWEGMSEQDRQFVSSIIGDNANPAIDTSTGKVTLTRENWEQLRKYANNKKSVSDALDFQNIAIGTAPQTVKTAAVAPAEPHDSGILNYVSRKDTQPMTAANTTEMDKLVVSELAYLSKIQRDVEGTYYRVSQQTTPTTVGEYCKRLLDELDRQNFDKNNEDYKFIKAMTESPRYKNLNLDYAAGRHDGSTEAQIVCVSDGSGYGIIGIEGTNGTVIDWINDSEFAQPDPTAEELYIADKVQQLLDRNGYTSFDMAGHSQGGRDAVTTAMLLRPDLQDKLNKVYSYDGPGYTKEFLQKYPELQRLNSKVINIRPHDSWVGRIFNPVGEVRYIKSDNPIFALWDHSLFNWGIDENGNFEYTELSPVDTAIDYAISGLMEFIGDNLEPYQIKDLLGTIFRLGYDENDPTALDFGNITKHLDELSLGDWGVIAEYGTILILNAVSGLAETLSEITGTISDICDVVGFVLAGVPYVGPVLAAIGEAMGIVSKVCSVVKVVCDVGIFILNWISREREKKRIERKNKYLAGNPEIVYYRDHLLYAADCLVKANNALMQADRDCDNLELRHEWSITDSDGLVEVFVNFIGGIVNVFKKIGIMTADLIYLHSNANLKKGDACCRRIAQNGYTLLKSSSGTGNDTYFKVNPSALTAAANEGIKDAESAAKEIENILEEIRSLGKVWSGEDFDSIKLNAERYMDSADKNISALNADFDSLVQIAQAYSNFQQTSYDDFEQAKR